VRSQHPDFAFARCRCAPGAGGQHAFTRMAAADPELSRLLSGSLNQYHMSQRIWNLWKTISAS
jgi:hypothetical protein